MNERRQRIKEQLKARLQKLNALDRADERKSRNKRLIAFGILFEAHLQDILTSEKLKWVNWANALKDERIKEILINSFESAIPASNTPAIAPSPITTSSDNNTSFFSSTSSTSVF